MSGRNNNVQKAKREERQKIKAQVAAVETSAKLDAMTKEMKNLQVIANNTAEIVPAAMRAQNAPVVRKRKSNKGKNKNKNKSNINPIRKVVKTMNKIIPVPLVLLYLALYLVATVNPISGSSIAMRNTIGGVSQVNEPVHNAGINNQINNQPEAHNAEGKSVELNQNMVEPAHDAGESINTATVHNAVDYNQRLMHDVDQSNTMTVHDAVNQKQQSVHNAENRKGVHNAPDNYEEQHTVHRRSADKLNVLFTSDYIDKHCDQLKDTERNQLKNAGIIADIITTLKTVYEGQFKLAIKDGYKKCRKTIGSLNRCAHALKFTHVQEYDQLLIDGKNMYEQCQLKHECVVKCLRMTKNEKDCVFDDVEKCRKEMYEIQKLNEGKLWSQFDTTDSRFQSSSFGCQKWSGWKSAGWLRGDIDVNDCKETASYNCVKGYSSCVESNVVNINRECQQVALAKTNTDWNRGNVCTIGSMTYNGTGGVIYSQQTIVAKTNPTNLCTLACFNMDALYQHFTNQPACSNCILPFELFWEKDCFVNIPPNKDLVEMHIYKGFTRFEFHGHDKFSCKNEYAFKMCCGGRGPGNQFARKTMYDKYCYCTLTQDDVYSTVNRLFHTLMESVGTPQFLFHITVFMVFALWNKTAATMYIALALMWIIPTAQAACHVEQLLPSDLTEQMGSETLQKLHVRVGQCFQAGGSTFELTKIEALIPFTFLKHVPYHIKATCSKLDWGCLYGHHDQVYHETSDCYEKCIDGVKVALQKEVPSFVGDGCAFGSSVSTRHDVCFSGGGSDTYNSIFEKLTSTPVLRLHLVAHATKEQKKFVMQSNEIENRFMKIHEYSVGQITAPKMYVHRMSEDYCSYTYVETDRLCSSRSFGDPLAWDPECLNVDQIWDAKNQQYVLKYDRMDYENVLLSRFQLCPTNYRKETGNDTLTLIEELNWVEMIVSGKHFQYADKTAYCDLKKLAAIAKPGISGYHSTTVITYKNQNERRCKFAAKLNGCVATEGTFMLMDAKQEVPMTYWCSYNASGILTLMSDDKEKRLINLNVVKNFVPHKTVYGNMIKSAYEKVSLETVRTSLSGFWGKLNWPEWTNVFADWLETEFWKFVTTCVLFLMSFTSFRNGNLMMTFVFGGIGYIVGFTEYIMAEEIGISQRIAQFDGGDFIATILMRVWTEIQYLIHVYVHLDGFNLMTALEILFALIHLWSICFTPVMLAFGWAFKVTTRIANRMCDRSEIQNMNMWYHWPLTSYLLDKILQKKEIEDDLDDQFAIIRRNGTIDWKKNAKSMIWCSDGTITAEEAQFEMKTEGWHYKRFGEICFVAGYRKEDKCTWWIPNHCLEGAETIEGIKRLGIDQRPETIGGQNPIEFKNVKGWSGYTIATVQGTWMFMGRLHQHSLWHRIRTAENDEFTNLVESGYPSTNSFVVVTHSTDRQFKLVDEYQSMWKIEILKDHKRTIAKEKTETDQGVQAREAQQKEISEEENEDLNSEEDRDLSTVSEDLKGDKFVVIAQDSNVLASKTGLFTKTLAQPGDDILVHPDGYFKYDQKNIQLSSMATKTCYKGGYPFVQTKDVVSFVECGVSHMKGYKAGIDHSEHKLDYWYSLVERKDIKPQCMYKIVNADTGEVKTVFNLFNRRYKPVFIKGESLYITGLVFPGVYPSGSILVGDDVLVGVASFKLKFEEKDCTVFVGPFSERRFYDVKYTDQQPNSDTVYPDSDLEFVTTRQNTKTTSIIGMTRHRNMVCKTRHEGLLIVDEREFCSAGWMNLSNQELEWQTKEAIETAGYVSEDIAGGETFQDPEIRERRLALYQKRSLDGVNALPIIFYTKQSRLPRQPNAALMCQTGLYNESTGEYDVGVDKILRCVMANNERGNKFAIFTIFATDYRRYWNENRLPIEVCVENNFYVDDIFESPHCFCQWPEIFMLDETGLSTYPLCILSGYESTEISNEWNFTGNFCSNKIDVGETGKETLLNFEQFRDRYKNVVIQGMVGNATGTGSFVYDDGKFYSQYHVTKGNPIHYSVKDMNKFVTGTADYTGRETDLVVYGGKTKMHPMQLGEVYCAYNIFYKIGIYLKYVKRQDSAQRKGHTFQVLEPVEWKRGQWMFKEHYGIPGMSGSPIVDKDGNLVGIYGLQRLKNEKEGKGTQAYVPVVSHMSEVKSLFNKAATHIRDVPLQKGKQYYTLVVPTGTGKSTTFVIELLKVNRGRILILQPNRVACINAYDRVCYLKKISGSDMNFRSFIELKMGTSEIDENRVYGDKSAQVGVTFATYGYVAAKIEMLSGYDIVMMDECHKIDDVDVVSVVLYSETCASKNTKFVRSTASSVTLPDEAQDILEGYVLSSTNFHIDEKEFEKRSRQNFKTSKNDPIFWFYGQGCRFDHCMGNVIVGIPKQDVAGKTVLVFCASKQECESGVKLAKERGIEAVAAYAKKEFDLKNIPLGTWIFATNIAQQSVTINGLYCVVDLGVEKKPLVELELTETGLRYQRRLTVGTIDLASRQQRKGRVGRQAPGLYFGAPISDAAPDCFNESLIPEIILKCEQLNMSLEQTRMLMKGKYAQLMKKHEWVRTDLIRQDRNYANYTHWAKLHSLDFVGKLKLAMQAEGDWLYLYLRCHALDERTLTDEMYRSWYVEHGKGDLKKLKHSVPSYVMQRTKNAPETWWVNYIMCTAVVPPEVFFAQTNYTFQSYMELRLDEDEIDYERLQNYVSPAGLDDYFEEQGETSEIPEGVGIFDALEGSSKDHEMFKEDAMGIVLSALTAIGLTAIGGSLVSLAINCKGDRYVRMAHSIEKENVKMVAKACAENYSKNETKVVTTLSILEKMKYHLNKIWEQVKAWAAKYFKKEKDEFKEDSLEFLWTALCAKVMAACAAGGGLIGLAAMPTLSSILGGSMLGLFVDRTQAVLGNMGAFVIITLLEGVAFWYAGLTGGLLVTGTAILTTLVKDMLAPRRNLMRQIEPNYSKYLSLLTGAGICAGFLTVTGKTMIAGMMAPAFISHVAPHVVGYGNMAGTFLMFKHLYTMFTLNDSGFDWADYLIGLLGGSVAAAFSMNILGFGIGVAVVLAMVFLRMAYKNWVESRCHNFKHKLDEVAEKMKEYDFFVTSILTCLGVIADPWSIVSMAIEFCYLKFSGTWGQNGFYSVMSRSGIPITMQIMDIMFRTVKAVWYGERQFRENADNSNLLEMLWNLIKQAYDSIKNFVTEKMTCFSRARDEPKTEEEVYELNEEKNMLLKIWNWIQDFFCSLMRSLKNCFDVFKAKFMGGIREAVTEGTDAGLRTIVEKVPLARHVINLKMLDEDDMRVHRSTEVDHGVVTSWIRANCAITETALAVSQLKIGSQKSDMTNPMCTEQKYLDCKVSEIWQLPVPLCNFFVKTRDMFSLAAHYKFDARMEEQTLVVEFMGNKIRVDTAFNEQYVMCRLYCEGTTTYCVVEPCTEGTKMYMGSDAIDIVFSDMVKGLQHMLAIDSSDALNNMSQPNKLRMVKDKLAQYGIQYRKTSGFERMKKATKLVGVALRNVAMGFVALEQKDVTIKPHMFDYCTYNKMQFKLMRMTQKQNGITEYKCPSLYYRKPYDSRFFIFPELEELCKSKEWIHLDFKKNCKFVVEGKADLYLITDVADPGQNLQAVCYNAGMNLMKQTGGRIALWSELGSKSVILLHKNEQLYYWSAPNQKISYELDVIIEEGRLYDGIKHIKPAELLDFNRQTRLDEFKDKTGRIENSLLQSKEYKMLEPDHFIVNNKCSMLEYLSQLFKHVNLVTDTDNKTLFGIAGQEIVKHVNKYLSAPLEEEETSEDEFEDAEEEKIDTRICHTYYPTWSAGFDLPTRGKLNMTWFPQDRSRMRSVNPSYRETMNLYGEVNRMGLRLSAKTWEKIRSWERYVLPNRISKDPNAYHNQVSRGVWKFQQLVEASEFFNNCTTVLSPTCGYGGFEQGMSIMYAKQKPRTIYSSTLLEEGHRAPDWNNISVDQSNVKIVRLVDENTEGKGNIKDSRFSDLLRQFICDKNPDLVMFDVGEFKNTCQAQFNYWMRRDKQQKLYSLAQGVEKIIEVMPLGSKLCLKFTGVFSGGDAILHQFLQYYKRCQVIKIGTCSLFSTEFYILASAKTHKGKGMDRAHVRLMYDQISGMVYDQLCRAKNIIYSRHERTRHPMRRSDWISSPGSGFAYRPIGEVEYPKGFELKLDDTPFGRLYERFEPNFPKRINKVQKYLKEFCGVTKKFSTEKRLGLKNVCEIGHYPMKINKVNEKHKTNVFIDDFLKETFGLNNDNSTYGHTQATAEYKKDSIQKRLDVNPGDLDHKVFMELMTVISTMKTEYGKSQVGQCRLLPHDKVLTMLNQGGATGMFSRYPNMRKFIEDNSTKGTDGKPKWYSIAMDFCLRKWSKGDNSHCFFSIMHKNEPKAKKNVENGVIDPDTADELSKYNSLPHRFIQYNDEITRIAHYILFGDLMDKANKQKIYKGTINGTPPHVVGRILRSMWDLHEPQQKETVIGYNQHIDVTIEKTELFPKNTNVLKEGTAAAAILDYSKWDTTVTKHERYLEYLFVRQFYPETLWPMIKIACEELAYGICLDREGHMFVRDGQRGSGEVFFTSFGNTLLVDANTFRCTAHAAGIPLAEICDTMCRVHVKINEKTTKTFEITRIPQVADGDDVVIFGTKSFFNQLEIQIDERLSQANKICRSGTKAGMTVVDRFADVSFCSYKYEPVLIGKNARTISLSLKQKIELANCDSNYKIFYLPTRPLPDILSRLRLTLKENATKWDINDERELGCKALTRSKLMSYLLMFPHVRLNRYACVAMLACMGDGNLSQYAIKSTWHNTVSSKLTTMGAFKSLYNVDSLNDVGFREYDADALDAKKLKKNLALSRILFTPRLRDATMQIMKVAYVRGIVDPRIMQWDSKLFSYYCDFIATSKIDESMYPMSVLKMIIGNRRYTRIGQ